MYAHVVALEYDWPGSFWEAQACLSQRIDAANQYKRKTAFDVAVSQSLQELLQLPQRKLVVSQAEIMLDAKMDNTIFVLLVEESRGSAGGRAAGSGSRKIVRVCGFSCKSGTCETIFETEEDAGIEQFDIPYSAVAMDIRLADGRPYVVQGVIDPGMISSYLSAIGNLK